jgi:hypothetical protein
MTPAPRSAWREPMLWLVWGLPLLVVLAGFATLALALRAGGADPVSAEVRRTAQIQVEDLAADRAALALGLQASFELDRDTGAATLRLQGPEASRAPRLRLRLTHPTRAADDRSLPLVRAGEAWVGRLPAAAGGHDWNLELVPEAGGWRLAGRLARGANAARLRPRLRN